MREMRTVFPHTYVPALKLNYKASMSKIKSIQNLCPLSVCCNMMFVCCRDSGRGWLYTELEVWQKTGTFSRVRSEWLECFPLC